MKFDVKRKRCGSMYIFSKNPSFWLEMLFSDADLAASEDLWRFCPCLEAFFTLGGRFAAVSHEIDHKAAKTYFE